MCAGRRDKAVSLALGGRVLELDAWRRHDGAGAEFLLCNTISHVDWVIGLLQKEVRVSPSVDVGTSEAHDEKDRLKVSQ